MKYTIVIIAIFLIFAQITFADLRLPAAAQPLDTRIGVYQKAVQANPKQVFAINHLAYAYVQKVRSTQDQSYSVMAVQLLNQALAIEPRNYDSLVYLSLVQMSQHRFQEALVTARKAVSINADNSPAYGPVGDAAFELGRYDQAAEAYQKMIDLRPGTPSYSRAAYYRKLVGDGDGALQLFRQAYDLADLNDPENRAWCLMQMGNIAFGMGKIPEAENIYLASLEIFPNYYNSLAGLAKVKVAQNKLDEAIRLFQKAIAIVPMPDFVAALGDAYVLKGNNVEAKNQYNLVEYIGLISEINQDIYNRQLALFYADHDIKLQQALDLAAAELRIRKDVYGYDAMAWCLYKNGRISEAVANAENALKMGTQDAMLFYHAGMIYAKAGDSVRSRQFLKKALALNPHFHPLFAKTATQTLGGLR